MAVVLREATVNPAGKTVRRILGRPPQIRRTIMKMRIDPMVNSRLLAALNFLDTIIAAST
jgi:hypothetical protein